MWVVKIGGSLGRDPLLLDWLRLLAAPHDRVIVIVPGGGAFADCVRDHQADWKFGDAPAHSMAILAMAQFGLMLEALCPALVVETALERLRQRHASGAAVVWIPLDLLCKPSPIEASWHVTSDSIAAWLAHELRADRLFLVKSCALPRECTIDELTETGIVDRRFAAFVRDAAFGVDVIGKGELGRMRALLTRQERTSSVR